MSEAPSVSFRKLVWTQFKRKRMAVVGLAAIGVLIAVAVAAPLIAGNRPIVMKNQDGLQFPAFSRDKNPELENYFRQLRDNPPPDLWAIYPPVPYNPVETNLNEVRLAPNADHWFGTDDIGRDLCARVVWGSRISLAVGLVAVGIYISIGVVLGAMAGYFGGWIDNLISRLIEIMICLPTLVFIITVIAFLGADLINVMVVIGLTGWPSVARLARAEFLRLRNMDYVQAIKSLGGSPARIMFRHVLPNAMAPVLVAATFGVASAILLESTLSFLGFGIPEPNPSWGGLLAQGRSYFSSWWLTVFPGGVIFLTILAYNLVGEGLRDAVDARLKE